jgi:putative hydroxymethylpyrimidine transport system permease protein
MATLIIYFPITTTFLDGLRHTDRGWLDLAQVMGGTRWRVMWHLRVPAALPHLASGLRVAAAVAPIGAVIGEWVGSAQGLGFVMIQANARVQVDVMFAALLMLALVAIVLYVTTDFLLRRLLPWVPGNERAASAD